jgi:hypothetical protein
MGVTTQLPDLWRARADPDRMYQLYLVRLQMNGMHDRVVAACRQIRRYAARGPGRRAGLFTFFFEVDSLVALKDYQAAWRQVQLRDKIIRGRRVQLSRRKWSIKDFSELAYTYAPLMYFLKRYRLGCELLETALAFWYQRPKAQSYDILFHVCNADEEPRIRPRVTLTHFYRLLGNDLKEWRLWPTFVKGLAAPLLRIAGVERKSLLDDPSQLMALLASLERVRRERVTSGVTRGQADLIQSPAKVKRWQKATRARIRRVDEDPARERTRGVLLQHFPELQGLAR